MGLRSYVLQRIAQMIMTLWVFVTLIFVLFRVMPGDPTSMYVPQGMTPEQREAILSDIELNKPLQQQYIDYLFQVLGGDLGTSYRYDQT
jgi:peptide/nickel transport system permease protein